MRKHLYRKSAWKEGVPRSLNYRSVLSGALWGSRRVGGLTVHSSRQAPAGLEVLDISLPGRLRGYPARPRRYLLPACPAARPRVSRDAGRAGGLPLPWDTGPSTRHPRLLSLTSGKLIAMGNSRKHRAEKQTPPPNPLQPPHPAPPPGTAGTPSQKRVLAGIRVRPFSTITPRHRRGQWACDQTPPRTGEFQQQGTARVTAGCGRREMEERMNE